MMNSRIISWGITILGAIGVLLQIISLIEKTVPEPISPLIINSIEIFILCAVLLYLFLYKRKFVNLYAILNIMALNNKLHSLRALVMVTHNEIQNKVNNFVIEEATFQYSIFASPNKAFYDVCYHLKFFLKQPYVFPFTKKTRCFRCYKIIEEGELGEVDCTVRTETGMVKVEPIIYSATESSSTRDMIKEMAGLYEFLIMLPRNIDSGEIVEIDMRYTVRNHMKKSSGQYNFVVMPKNYGKKIRQMKIIVEEEIGISQLELHQINSNDDVARPAVFALQETKDNKKIYSLYEDFIIPDMESVYFTQLNYRGEKDHVLSQSNIGGYSNSDRKQGRTVTRGEQVRRHRAVKRNKGKNTSVLHRKP